MWTLSRFTPILSVLKVLYIHRSLQALTPGPAVNSSCLNFEVKHFLNFSIPDVPLTLSGKSDCLPNSLSSLLQWCHYSITTCPLKNQSQSAFPCTQSAICIKYYICSTFLSKNFWVRSRSFSSFPFSSPAGHGHFFPLSPQHLHSARPQIAAPLGDGKAFRVPLSGC